MDGEAWRDDMVKAHELEIEREVSGGIFRILIFVMLPSVTCNLKLLGEGGARAPGPQSYMDCLLALNMILHAHSR